MLSRLKRSVFGLSAIIVVEMDSLPNRIGNKEHKKELRKLLSSMPIS